MAAVWGASQWHMKHKNNVSRQLMFLEPINKNSDEDRLIERLIERLEALGFNIIGKEEEDKDEN